MLMIKLSKVGKTNQKVFRLIISEKSRDPFGNVLEILGSYDPYTKKLQAKEDRINYWLGQGAQMTSTVNNLLVGNKMVKGEKILMTKRVEKPAEAEAKEAPQVAKAEETPAEAVTEEKA